MSSSTVTEYPENIQFSFTAERGNWTEEGCRVEEVDDETGLITCECNHLTNFAILVVSLHEAFHKLQKFLHNSHSQLLL